MDFMRVVKRLVFLVFLGSVCSPVWAGQLPEITLAVEFVDHAACAHIAREKGWFEEEGLAIRSFDSYATGMALSAALCKGGIDAAYICLFPAINAYANGHVPLKVVCGTHLYGYSLVVNPNKVATVADLNKPDIRLGCTRDGSPPAVLLHKLIALHDLDKSLPARTRRMPPPKLLLALKTGQLDAIMAPEQYPTMAEQYGFKELVRAGDLWPRLQGSVLIVRQALIDEHPEIVEKLVRVTQRGITFIHENPEASARIVSEALDVGGKAIIPGKLAGAMHQLKVSPEAVRRSLAQKMACTADVNPAMVQEMIDYAARLGYIKRTFKAGDILDLRYLKASAKNE